MKYSKLVLTIAIIVLFGMTAAYAGDKKGKTDKKCAAVVKACKDVNDSNAVKKCAADCKKQCCAKKGCAAKCKNKCAKNAAVCSKNAAAKGEKKGWYSSWFGKKDAKTSDAKSAKSCSMKNQEKCKKECAAMKGKCNVKDPNDANKPKCKKNCAKKCCKKTKSCQKPADPNAPKAK
jgi:hypothetical protein